MPKLTEWYHGVDLDGTLAIHYWGKDTGKKYDPLVIGGPIPLMVNRVKEWLAKGEQVRIITARVTSHPAMFDEVVEKISVWCLAHIGQVLPVQNYKDKDLRDLWDDRAIQVVANTGKLAVEEAVEAVLDARL